MRSIIALCLAVLLAACATAHNYPPVVVAPDTARFSVYLANHATDSAADQAVVEDLTTYRDTNGYRSYAIVERKYFAFPTRIEYTALFTR